MDAHSFTVGADYRVYAATMTGFGGGSANTLHNVFASDGLTALKANGPGGAIGSPRPIAGPMLPTTSAYYVRVNQFKTGFLPGAIRSYDFYLRVLSGSPIPEREPKGQGAPQAPRSNGWRGRVIGPATAKTGSFAITVDARDTIGVIVGIDLERGAPVWDVIAGTGEFTGSFMVNARDGVCKRKALPHRSEFCLKVTVKPALPPGLVLGTSRLLATALTLPAQSASPSRSIFPPSFGPPGGRPWAELRPGYVSKSGNLGPAAKACARPALPRLFPEAINAT